jgi:hypothetical protein
MEGTNFYFSYNPVGDNKSGGEVRRLYNVGYQRNERRKGIHFFKVLML